MWRQALKKANKNKNIKKTAAHWEWKADAGWEKFDDDSSDQIEKAYQDSESSVALSCGRFAESSNQNFYVNFKSMLQSNDKRGLHRGKNTHISSSTSPSSPTPPEKNFREEGAGKRLRLVPSSLLPGVSGG